MHMPDFVLDVKKWFKHFDMNGSGISKQELVAALMQTYKGEVSKNNMELVVRSVWPGNATTISILEFCGSGVCSIHAAIIERLGPPPITTPESDQNSGMDSGNNQTSSARGGHSASGKVPVSGTTLTMPDFVLDKRAWFMHFCSWHLNMGQHDLVKALTYTYQGTAKRDELEALSIKLEGHVRSIWPADEPVITESDFTRKGGMHAALLSRLGSPPIATSNEKFHDKADNGTMQPQPTLPKSARPGTGNSPKSNKARSAAMHQQYTLDHLFDTLPKPKLVEGGFASKLPDGGIDGAGIAGAMPQNGQQSTGMGKQTKALLIGINYFGSPAALRGCIHDASNVYKLLTDTYGWKPGSMRVLTDDNVHAMPTRRNIIDSLRWLAAGVMPGDVLFLHFSGHGAQQHDPNGYEEDGMNETILPCDFDQEGMISDELIGELLVRCLPANSRLIVVMDCCHSGTGIDLPFKWKGSRWTEETNPYHVAADVQLFSGCEDSDTSADAMSAYKAPGGAMTTAFCDALRRNPHPSYPELMESLRVLLRQEGFSQKPQLSSSQRFPFNRPFLFTDIMPNSNPKLGRTFRKKFPPKPRRVYGPLQKILMTTAAVWGGLVALDTLTWAGSLAVNALLQG